jgi:hypothetical protein
MTQAPLEPIPQALANPKHGWRKSWRSGPAVRYPDQYLWFVLFSSLDIMLTWIILHLGGSEVNPIANAIIELWDLPGAIGFKFGLMIMVLLVCEYVGSHRDALGRSLVTLAVVISAFPVVYSFVLIALHTPRIVP